MASATLLQALCLAGARKSDGTAVASGKAWLYLPGTTTDATIYADESKQSQLANPILLDSSGRPNASSYPDGVFVDAPTRVLVQTSAGITVSDTVFVPASAGAVAVANDGFTGTSPTTGGQVAGGETTLDAVLTSAFASTGGVDFQYLESAGATERSVHDKFQAISIDVKDFGAKGDGIQVDTSYIQAAMNRAAALGGGNVTFPKGTFLIDGVLTLSSKNAVSFKGVGPEASIIKSSSATANIMTLTSCNGFSVESLGFTNSSASTGTALALSGCSNVIFENIIVDSYLVGASYTGNAGVFTVVGCQIQSSTADVNARGIIIGTGTAAYASILGGYIYSSFVGSASVELKSAASNVHMAGAWLGRGVMFNSAYTGTDINIVGCTLNNTTPLVFGAATAPARLRIIGCAGYDGASITVTSGGTATPDRAQGEDIEIHGSTTGGAYTTALPTPAPAANDRDVYLTLSFHCAAGAPITGWGVNAGYHLSAGPSTTDTQITTYRLRWDPETGVWREQARSVTT